MKSAAVLLACTIMVLSAVSTRAFVSGRSLVMPRIIVGSAAGRKSLSSFGMRMASSATSSDAADIVKQEVADNNVMIFSKSRCPFCMATKQLFSDLGVDYKVIELDQDENGWEIQKALGELTGQRTVPNTFIGGKHLGGNDVAQAAYQSGQLQKVLGIEE